MIEELQIQVFAFKKVLNVMLAVHVLKKWTYM